MKVSELTGALLDYWVARAEGYEVKEVGAASVYVMMPFGERGRCLTQFYPSTSWAQGGPIIEKVLMLDAGPSAYYALSRNDDGSFDISKYHHGDHIRTMADGPTPLVAAMRAYVASKFGDTVPDEVAA